MTRVCMISGHRDLTIEEFDAHYAPHILVAMANGDDFVVGDARGADHMAQDFLKKWRPIINSLSLVRVYHMLTIPRHNAGFETKSGYTSNKAKDAALTQDSDYDLLWIRPNKHSSVSGRVSGTESNQIRRKVKDVSK